MALKDGTRLGWIRPNRVTAVSTYDEKHDDFLIPEALTAAVRSARKFNAGGFAVNISFSNGTDMCLTDNFTAYELLSRFVLMSGANGCEAISLAPVGQPDGRHPHRIPFADAIASMPFSLELKEFKHPESSAQTNVCFVLVNKSLHPNKAGLLWLFAPSDSKLWPKPLFAENCNTDFTNVCPVSASDEKQTHIASAASCADESLSREIDAADMPTNSVSALSNNAALGMPPLLRSFWSNVYYDPNVFRVVGDFL